MEEIKVRETDEMVRIEITIEYIGPYKYNYFTTENGVANYKSEDIPPKSYPHEYNIGKGVDILAADKCNNTFDLELRNPTDNNLIYVVKIEWFQGDNPDPIYVWPIKPLWKRTIKKGDLSHPINMTCNYKYNTREQ